MVRDSVDLDEQAYDSEPVNRYERDTARANLADDRPTLTYAEQDRIIAAHKARTIAEMSAWAVARSRPINPAKGDV